VAAEYAKRSGGRNFDASGSYSYDAIQVMATRSSAPPPPIPTPSWPRSRRPISRAGCRCTADPFVFNETGDNPNASTAMLQVLGQKTRVVWPKDVAEQRFVFPRPKA